MLSVCHEDIPMLDYANNTMELPASSIQDTDNESLLRSRGSSYHPTPANTVDEAQKSAQRRISWHKKPTYMVLFAVLGLTLEVTHHVYYSSLNGNEAITNFQKQFAVTLGNLIAFAVVSSFLAATCAAYPQYLWMSVRKKASTLRTLDKITMSLAAILPPGTLIIVNGLLAKTSNVSMPLIDWSVVKAFQEDDVSTTYTPGTVVINIGSKSAESSDIVPIGGPAPNSSYSLNIIGPYVQCGLPNHSEQIYFDQYVIIKSLAQSNIFTSTSWMTHYQNATTLSDSLVSPWPSMIYSYLSAFDPWMHPGKDGLGWLEASLRQ
ncbi:hypothetical protein DID88_001446 [Monilinia fructigena]|uniref:Uncharacterized protein n=1 Tax=Monilinia fructigena TaxID=38457 RepID=A0A395IX46_9HELO|nr:hypothetical protein DID88_001446 [Monilinia fructigena]